MAVCNPQHLNGLVMGAPQEAPGCVVSQNFHACEQCQRAAIFDEGSSSPVSL
eukprot:CAMPEP_0115716562 /NCGR_PEP_ID=MMETSP0272-20121206/76388_1 /TAXON_ID=71861 /ORGANISM="Scrippsiella trochoidea, Strain CCMP3099" /LENGTH=51 /DNA_ID=CAMNT_0003158881 /DNA_START=43 /DNA_END=194 /DNA_ORIENTATION=-